MTFAIGLETNMYRPPNVRERQRPGINPPQLGTVFDRIGNSVALVMFGIFDRVKGTTGGPQGGRTERKKPPKVDPKVMQREQKAIRREEQRRAKEKRNRAKGARREGGPWPSQKKDRTESNT